jgi:hypothetical protein
MSKLGLVIVIVLMAARINAQNYPAPASDPPTYFVLIQADSGQAFYIRLDSQLYASSPAGHLILAKLKDSAYPITVGFPGQIFPEQRYLLNSHQKDAAFQLIRQDNSWRLFDDQGQTMPALADPAAGQMPLLAGAKKDDAFSQMMAAIVRDTAVMYNTYAASSDSASSPAIANTPAANTPAANTPVANTPVANAPIQDSGARDSAIRYDNNASSSSLSKPSFSSAAPSSPTGVVKLSEHKSTQSLSLVFTDHPVDKKTDTIDVIIPVDTKADAVRPPSASSDTALAPARVKSPDISHTKPAHHYPYTDTARYTDTTHTWSSVTYTTHLDSNRFIVDTRDNIHTERIPKVSPDTARLRSPLPGRAPKTDTSAKVSTALHKSNLPFINSDCHAFATDYDVDKLRVRMLSANKDDDRIQVAYKIFKTKCFSTSQVRALCAVFTTDDAKFKLLETAYPFVSDDRFPELVNLLSDPVYTGKFQTLTGRH